MRINRCRRVSSCRWCLLPFGNDVNVAVAGLLCCLADYLFHLPATSNCDCPEEHTDASNHLMSLHK